jgi:1-acyl-sn-glycerol-3-phosphate acyltransferase
MNGQIVVNSEWARALITAVVVYLNVVLGFPEGTE